MMSYPPTHSPHKARARRSLSLTSLLLSAALLTSNAAATPPTTSGSVEPSAQVTTPSTGSRDEAQLEGSRRAVTDRVQAAVEQLKGLCPTLKLTQRVSSLSPNLALKMALPLEGEGGQAKAEAFVSRFAGLWSGLDVKVTELHERRGRTYATLSASITGTPVLNQDARLMIDQEGRAQQLSSALSAVYQTRQARLSEAEALRVALGHLQLPLDAPHLTRLGFVVHAGVATAAYEVQAGAQAAQRHPVVLVDAVEGVVLSVSDRVRR